MNLFICLYAKFISYIIIIILFVSSHRCSVPCALTVALVYLVLVLPGLCAVGPLQIQIKYFSYMMMLNFNYDISVP